jgi:hypothetical protein
MSDEQKQPNDLQPRQSGQNLSDDVMAQAKAAVAEMAASLKDSMKDSMLHVGEEQSAQHPSQDPPRHRPKL